MRQAHGGALRLPFTGLLAGVVSRKYDAAITGLLITRDRQKQRRNGTIEALQKKWFGTTFPDLPDDFLSEWRATSIRNGGRHRSEFAPSR